MEAYLQLRFRALSIDGASMGTLPPADESHASQLRLLLEELCCDLCRFEHIAADGLLPEDVCITREYDLGSTAVYADVRVAPGDKPPYFVEIKYGYTSDAVLKHLRRKYKKEAALPGTARKSFS